MRLLSRPAMVTVVIVGVAAVVGLLLSGDEGRRVGLPPQDETVATLLDDGTPVFVTRDGDESVRVLDARTPARPSAEGTVALADLLDGLVGWCDGQGFVDDLDPAVTFAPDGRTTGATEDGLGVYEVNARERAHVIVGEAWPAGRAPVGRGGCGDPSAAEHHGDAMRHVELAAVPAGSSWVVEAAIDLRHGVACAPPDDPLAWPLCPDDGVEVELPDRAPATDLAAEHGRAYAERRAYGFVGEFLVARETDDGPLTQVWRLPGEVEVRAAPLELRAQARLTVRDEFRPGFRWAVPAPVPGDDEPLLTLEISDAEGDRVPRTLGVVEATTLVDDDGEELTGERAAAALRSALDEDRRRRWDLTLRRDPLDVPPRLERVEPADD